MSRRFSRVNQPRKCTGCGKLTTDNAGGGTGLCGPCFEAAGLANEHGFTTSVEKRIAAIQGAHWSLIVAEAVIWVPDERTAREKELALHQRFEARRIRGEWFLLDELAISEIRSLMSVDDREVCLRLRK